MEISQRLQLNPLSVFIRMRSSHFNCIICDQIYSYKTNKETRLSIPGINVLEPKTFMSEGVSFSENIPILSALIKYSKFRLNEDLELMKALIKYDRRCVLQKDDQNNDIPYYLEHKNLDNYTEAQKDNYEIICTIICIIIREYYRAYQNSRYKYGTFFREMEEYDVPSSLPKLCQMK